MAPPRALITGITGMVGSHLADYLLKLAESPETGATVTISTTVDTPSMWQLLRREALKSA